MSEFARDYPDVELDVTTDDSRVDLVSAGFDAGIQFGEYIAQDMVAVRVSPDLRPAIPVGPLTAGAAFGVGFQEREGGAPDEDYAGRRSRLTAQKGV